MREVDGGVELAVRVTPGAKRNEVLGWSDGVLRVKIAAPPLEGAANDELIRFLARDLLGIPRSSVRVVRGERSRDLLVGVPLRDSRVKMAQSL